MKKKKLSFILILHTLFVALFADIRSVNWALSHGGFISEGIMNSIYPLVIVLILITAFLIPNKLSRPHNGYAIFVAIYIVGAYFCTIFLGGHPTITMSMFFALTVFAFTIPIFCMIDARIFLKGIMFYPCFAVTRLDSIFAMETEWQNYMNMDASYSFLVPVIATITYLFFFYKNESNKEKAVTVILSLCNMVFCARIIVHGSRGVVFSIFCLLLFIFIIKMDEGKSGIVLRKRRLRIAAISLVLIIVSYITVFSYIYKNLQNVFGVEFYAFEKIARMGAEGDFDNGRSDIAKKALGKFVEEPIFGYGVDRAAEVTGGNYPHNFVIQILFDGGLVFFFILLVPVIYHGLLFLKSCTKDELTVFCALFFSSVPGALFSQNLWMMPVLWMTFGLCFSKGFVSDERQRLNIK